ncbi:ThuA domain-containing protein [Terrimonas sp. NA20]|uniref:ThuA domain-containing protein n=1 Tax=Terrimonas ginsenosidimutans TaxID=2908004 RepID=A0ABS9KP07_9BACT|nr:ThuA domain-containing protein [Terrimonas ginsenosidimutans]MCG2614010.1 ThuA domain-containing protein [Terrimonas ginsenosidimutans]
MKLFYHTLLLLALGTGMRAHGQMAASRFNVLVLAENGGHHVRFSAAAGKWLDQLATDSSFSVTYINNTDSITGAFLSRFRLFIQLDYPPYNWTPEAAAGFTDYIETGKGGWIGLHHATLLGEFDGFKLWDWFWKFMGRVRFKSYIPDFADGTVRVEDSTHPVMKGLPKAFRIEKEEWYTYDRSPRAHARVLANVDESSYHPDSDRKMGDHPVIWSNEKMKARNIYIFMGHSPDLFQNPIYVRLFRNAIFWAAGSSAKNQ